MNTKDVLILYSSGLDSLVNLFILKDLWKLNPHLLFIDYDQKAKILELEMTKKISKRYNIPLHIVKTSLNVHSKLIDDISSITNDNNIIDGREVPVELVPYRNIAFAHIAATYARKKGLNIIAFGFNLSESGAYPDNTDRFLENLNELYLSSTYYPLEDPIFFVSGSIHFTKTELVLLGKFLNVDFSLSMSCYYPKEDKHCGKCNSCRYRIEAFKRAGIKDDAEYNTKINWQEQDINNDKIKELLEIVKSDKEIFLKKIQKFRRH